MNNYAVYITPLESDGVYGSEITVTEEITLGAVGSIIRQADDGDFDIGRFTYGALDLIILNRAGRFNGPEDWRSIFQYSRDLAKVRVDFVDGDSVARTVFQGLINEEGTGVATSKGETTFLITANDSVIKNSTVAAGAIGAGLPFSEAIKLILNTPRITSVLNYIPGNINVGLDLVIDDESAFDVVPSQAALDQLLQASSSVLLIDSSNNIIVRSREINPAAAVTFFYGGADTLGRGNIKSLDNFNSGLHRMFNSVKVNTRTVESANYVTHFGARQKAFQFDFITDQDKMDLIAAAILNEFKAPKFEMELVTDTDSAQGLDIYDLVGVDVAPRLTPYNGGPAPVYGSAVYDTDIYPYEDAPILINARNGYKIIGVTENPKDFTTTLKLRQIGSTVTDGSFDSD